MGGRAEPAAIIGIGCRFPGGADSPEAFWDLLREGRNGITTVPAERWQSYEDTGGDVAAVLRRATRSGGYLADIEGFDSEFFGLTPREAEFMDPQQRILLETTWDALENAGIPPHSLGGGETGVFVGIGSDDYGRRMLEDLPSIEAWTGIGAAMCAAANRISYALDLHGPSLAVDTACSSSLVALHLACQSLASGESPLAIAAGVNLNISPGLVLTLDAAGALAPDGRSKPFDASADGYGRGEGCGVLVLKRLDDARRDGDRVLAIVRGTAVNQDGRTNGIMAPNAEAQQRVIERACRQAGVASETVDYVEAHGTGTPLGDSLEVSALGAVYGSGREPGRPCLIGSAKANIGHLEAAAGVTGVIKAVLALRHAEIPPSLIHSTLMPALKDDTIGLKVVTEPTPWPSSEHPRRAGVSAFGYGGTIAHVVLEESDAEAEATPPPSQDRQARVFPLSAASETGLRQHAGRLADWLDHQGEGVPLASVGHTLALRRSHLRHRAAVVASDSRELVTELRLTAMGEGGSTVVDESPSSLVWVFSGHGSQWIGMGRGLLATQPAFAAVIDSLEPIFLAEIGFSPRQALIDGDLDGVDRVQSMIFAVQMGLAEVWRSFGVRPDAVIGHSVGEIAAAVACGALSLHDGARLVCRRSRLLRRVAGDGAMAMVELPADQVTERLAGRDDVVTAILAAPSSTVVSGPPAAVSELTERWRADGVTVHPVATDVAFHGPQMDVLVAELASAAADLSPQPPKIPMYSTSLSDPRATITADGAYWAGNLRKPVRLESAVRAAAQDGHRAFLEVSAHPVVAHSIEETLSASQLPDAFVGISLRRNRPETATLLAAAAAMHCHGLPLDWNRMQPGGELVTLPGNAWQHRPHWRQSAPVTGNGDSTHDPHSHTLLGSEVEVAGSALQLWRTRLTAESRPYPGSHTIDGMEVVPAASLVTTLLAAASDGEPAPTLSKLSLTVPLIVDEPREVQILRDHSVVRIASRAATGSGGAWLTHATVTVADHSAGPAPLDGARKHATAVDPGLVQRYLSTVGVPTMAYDWTIEELSRGERALHARVVAEPPSPAQAGWAPLLDAAMSIAPALFPGAPVLRMVRYVEDIQIMGEPPVRADIVITLDADHDDTVHVRVTDSSARTLLRLTGLRYTAVDRERLPVRDPASLVSELAWRALPLPADEEAGPRRPIAVCGPDAVAVQALADRLSEAGADCVVVSDGTQIREPTDLLLLPPLPRLGDSIADAAAQAAWLLTSAVQRLAAPARLWCLTSGVAESAAESQLALSPLWGVGRIVAGEHPGIWGGVIDLPPDGLDSPAAATLIQVVGAATGEDVIVLRDGSARVPRLVRPAADLRPKPLRCQADATYLVTGGLGALGLAVAGHLADRGARHIVLAGRRTPSDDAAVRISALREQGVDVRSVVLDVADPEEAARVLSPGALGMPPIRGLVHAAGTLDNRMITGVDEESLRTVMHPKVRGAWVLHELFPPGTLDFFVLFSSCGPLLGLPGQAAYAAANAFLDALAAHRRATDRGETMALGWTSWRGMGMSVNEIVDAELSSRGVTDISAVEAFASWDLAAALGGGHYPVLGITSLAPGMPRLRILDELLVDGDASAPSESALNGLTDLGPEDLRNEVTSIVASLIAKEMRLSVQQLDARRPLAEQGLDSVLTIVIRRRLEKRFGHSLPADLLWHQPTVTAIADHLAGLLTARHDAERVR
ncbi:MAG: type I polyketide synthase [Jatrophihabitantaceae bacterium]